MPKFKRVHLVVMDSVGIGAAPDSDKFFNAGVADTESDTLGHISEKAGLEVPNMTKIGLGNILEIQRLRQFLLKTIQLVT